MENTENKNNETIIINHESCTKTKCYMKDSLYCMGNFCISCGENMGDNNPRQYCRKIY